jgi:hypothetical protein
MNSETVLIVSVGGSVAASLVIWRFLQGSLREMMGELCERTGGNDFWARYTFLMLVLAPLALVLMFTPEQYTEVTQALRRITLVVVLSQFASYMLVGRSLFKTVRPRTRAAAAVVEPTGNGG